MSSSQINALQEFVTFHFSTTTELDVRVSEVAPGSVRVQVSFGDERAQTTLTTIFHGDESEALQHVEGVFAMDLRRESRAESLRFMQANASLGHALVTALLENKLLHDGCDAAEREAELRDAWLRSLPEGACRQPPPQELLDAEAFTRAALRLIARDGRGETPLAKAKLMTCGGDGCGNVATRARGFDGEVQCACDDDGHAPDPKTWRDLPWADALRAWLRSSEEAMEREIRTRAARRLFDMEEGQ